MTRDPDTLPTPADPSGPCPRCGRASNFQNVQQSLLVAAATPDGEHERVHVLKCMGCKDSCVVVVAAAGAQEQGVHWYPAPGAGQLDPAVPAGVASCYDEGVRCLAIGAARAAAVMFRSALHLYVKDKGSAAAQGERHLKTALQHMKNDGDLHSSLWDWADHLNQLGNEGAHPEDYDDVTKEEAAALGRFVQHLIRHEYEMPAELQRARALGGKPAPTPAVALPPVVM